LDLIVTTNKINAEEFERYELLAENGHPTYQYFFSAAINARSNYPDRLVQAYKWAFLSILLGEQQSKDILSYLAHSMSQEDISRADVLAEDWLSNKFDEDNEEEKTKWSQTLRKLIAGNSLDE
jgi:hypothetical protein